MATVWTRKDAEVSVRHLARNSTGDDPAALAAGLGKLGNGQGPASLIGAIVGVVAVKAARPAP